MAKSLEDLKKEIEDANTLKVRASERILSLRQQYTQKVDELKKLGINNPKEIESEIKKRDIEIENLKKKISDSIPSDIIQKYTSLDFSTMTISNDENPF